MTDSLIDVAVRLSGEQEGTVIYHVNLYSDIHKIRFDTESVGPGSNEHKILYILNNRHINLCLRRCGCASCSAGAVRLCSV